MEVLQDQLLQLFTDLPGLLPNDVLVMAPDIEAGRVVGFVIDGNPAQQALVAFAFELVIAGVMIATSRRLAPPA